MKEILKIDNVVKYYGKGTVATKALDGVSFNVCKGEFTAIMGASGSGKSTLLNVIATIDRVSGGSIYIEGDNIAVKAEKDLSAFRRDKLGFVFQEYNLLDTLTVGENIVLPLNLKRTDVEKTKQKLAHIAAALGVEDQLSKYPCELSGGQRQRAACARAIISDPAIVLADEPTGALDSKNSRILMNTFELMNRSLQCTVLMVTHDPLVGSYANRVLFMKDGKIWNEVLRGDRGRGEMHRDILRCMAALGGEDNAF